MEKILQMETTNKASSKKMNNTIISSIAPYMGLILSIGVFQILTGGKLLTVDNIQNLTNQVIITALVSIGAVFIFGIGCFDISLGSVLCLSAVVSGMVAISTGNLFLTFIICIIIPVAMGIAKGIFASYVEVPFFIFTIVLFDSYRFPYQ